MTSSWKSLRIHAGSSGTGESIRAERGWLNTAATPCAAVVHSGRPFLSLGRIGIALTAMVAFSAAAQTRFVPSAASFAYDYGVMPSVASDGTSVIEVHEGTANGFGPLWYRTGHIQGDATVIWAPQAFQYDNGGRPSVSVSGTNVIEVHEGTANGFGPLWYKTGRIQRDGTIVWSASGFQYDNGARPSVALCGNDVMEVHQGTANGFGPLWYKTGHIQANGAVFWSSTGYPYDNGGTPRVAMSGPNIIEVHQGTANIVGPLWYKTARFQADARVVWSPTAVFYDNGGSPAVALAGATILEVHEGTSDIPGPLWLRAGQFQPDGNVLWNAVGSEYDKGGNPSIALAGAVALEVHQAGTGFGLEFCRTFRY